MFGSTVIITPLHHRIICVRSHDGDGLSTAFQWQDIDKFDIMEDKRCQNFIGGYSCYDNLQIVGGKKELFTGKLQEKDQEHFLYSLLTIDDSLIASLLEKMGINKETFLSQVQDLLNKKPKVSGGQVYMSNDLNQVLLHGEDEMKAMKDEYVSVEHLFLAMIKHPNKAVKELFRAYGITRDRFLQVLSQIRGGQKVTSDNPEETYDSLEKYGYDLVKRAREQKLENVGQVEELLQMTEQMQDELDQ